MRANNPHLLKRYNDCFELYKRYNGRNIARIEREMGACGHDKFSRRILYGRFERGIYKPGWVERYEWKKALPESIQHPLEGTSASVSNRPSLQHFITKTHDPANRSFREWLEKVSPNMRWDWRHQRLIYDHLERVTSGECKRLMIFLPPRHGKSELVTARYTAWRLEQDPTLNVILGSYNQRLANRFSRKVRRVLADAGNAGTPARMDASASTALSVPPASAGGFLSTAETQSRGEKETGSFPAEGSSDSGQTSSAAHGSETNPLCLGIKSSSNPRLPRRANSVDEWETIEGGGLRAVGVGGGVTGFGASLIIIDDPVKSRAEAESQTYRDNVWDWFNDDLYTRLEPNGAIILIQTRWHESDLAGRLLKEMSDGGEYWDVVNLPAIAEDEKDALDRKPGEALCPDRYDEKALEKLRRKLGSYSFSALYQQRPTPLDGGIFKRDWLVNNVVESLPADVKLVRSYDLAVSMRTTADYTASILGGFDKMGNFYIADCMRKRMEFPEQRRFIVDCMRREPRAEHGIELALHGKALVQELRRLPGIRATALRGIRVDEDKVTRALAWANLAEEGKLKLVRGPYLQDFIEEVCAFPNGKYDDQVDAVSLAVKMTTERKFRHAGF